MIIYRNSRNQNHVIDRIAWPFAIDIAIAQLSMVQSSECLVRACALPLHSQDSPLGNASDFEAWRKSVAKVVHGQLVKRKLAPADDRDELLEV